MEDLKRLLELFTEQRSSVYDSFRLAVTLEDDKHTEYRRGQVNVYDKIIDQLNFELGKNIPMLEARGCDEKCLLNIYRFHGMKCCREWK